MSLSKRLPVVVTVMLLTWACGVSELELTEGEELAESDAMLGANLALNRPTLTSSVEKPNFDGRRAVDGKSGSRWSSALTASAQWLRVDLGHRASLGRVMLSWDSAFATEYEVQASDDGSSWSRLVAVSGGDGGVDELPVRGSARFVRLYATRGAGSAGYSLRELEVYAPPPPSVDAGVVTTADGDAGTAAPAGVDAGVVTATGGDAGTAAPGAGDPWSVPLGSRPTSGAISLSGCRDVVIENKTFKDLGAGVIAIRLENCQRVTIRAVDFIDVAEGVYALNSTDVTIVDARYSNILGPHARTGANVGNFVQFNNVQRGLIRHNKGKGGDTEDIVSLFKTSYVTVEDNQFEGTNWTSPSGSGIALGDNGGTGNIARRNVLVNPGQVGIFIAGGTDHQMIDNIVYGEQRPYSNVGMYVWNQSTAPCSGNIVSGNRVFWKNASGALNPYWNSGNCGAVAGTGNVFNVAMDPAPLRVSF